MYQNLRAEITRKGMTIKNVAEEIGITYPTLLSKMKGVHEFTYREVKAIRDCLNPSLDLEYLFNER